MVRARVVGKLNMEDEAGIDTKLLAVPHDKLGEDIAAAVVLRMDGGNVSHVRIALTNLAPTALRAADAHAVLAELQSVKQKRVPRPPIAQTQREPTQPTAIQHAPTEPATTHLTRPPATRTTNAARTTHRYRSGSPLRSSWRINMERRQSRSGPRR